jgi:hypothetical protein
VVFANIVLQTLYVKKISPAKIMSVQVTLLSTLEPAEIAGNGAATLCAEMINSAVSSAIKYIDALNATTQKTAARGKMVKKSAIKA